MGRASVKGGIDTDRIGPLISDFRIAARAVNTSGPLHLLYLIAPPDVVDTIQIDWSLLFDRISIMPQNEANLISLLGFPEGYILWKATGYPIKRVSCSVFVVSFLFTHIHSVSTTRLFLN